jgi:acyl-CoA synthetase (AMP-forming)/AMP-acid ligase II
VLPQNVIEVLRQAAAELPDQLAVVSDTEKVTYSELARRAEVAAFALRERGIDRFAVQDSDPIAIWTLIAAASLSGAEACVYPIAANDATVAELRQRLDHATLITSRDVTGDGVLSPATLLSGTERLTDEPPEDGGMLILTTGTSGHPQAAQHTWTRLLRVAGRINPTPDQRWLLAYGLNQFGGLQILLHVTSARATLVAGESFQPRDGLAAMRRWGVTHASGTPTFWRFLLAEIRADQAGTPPLRQVTLGGEAVPSALLDQLRATFTDARISQIYGATEMGQNITVRDGKPGLPLDVLEEGGDVVFKIVDGELWVRSESSMLGYYDQAPLETGSWRATGDLVEVVDDRILFRGRKSEVINVGGVKVHPLPIEDRVSRVDGVALVRAFGRPSAVTGRIVALEVVPVEGADEETVRRDIREACQTLPPAARPRNVTFVATMDTAGNKLSRGSRD